MRILRLLVLGALAVARPATAQTPAVGAPSGAAEPSRLAIVVADGRVYVYPSRPPLEGEGWIITRDGRSLTASPLVGAQGPAEFATIVGPDLAFLETIADAEGAFAVWRRLRAGGTAAGLAQVLSPRAALALGALLVDSTAVAGATYRYEASLVRLARPDSVRRRAAALVRVVPTVLAAPAVPRARVTDGRVALTWEAPAFTASADDPIVAYVVERADSTGAFVRITQRPVMRLADRSTGFTDETADAGRWHRYRIRAADLLGRLSAPSPEVGIRAPGTRGPLPPIGVGAEAADGRIRVVWTFPPEPQARRYVVERSVGGDSSYARITRSPIPYDTPEFVDTLVRGREIYAYRVRVLDDAGRIGPPSNPATTRGVDTRAPAVPAALAVVQTAGHTARLSWRAVPDRDVRGYEVSRREPADTAFARLTGTPLRALAYADSGYDGARLEPGRTYTWRVVAVDSSGNVSAPAEVALRIPDDEAPEPARSLLVRNQLGRWVELSWTASPSQDVARYVIERSSPGAAVVAVATLPRDADLAWRDTTAVRGRPTRWSVIAVDSAGNRATPLADTLTFRDLAKPPAPRRVTAVRAAGTTTVRWERVVSRDLRGYVVYRAERTDGLRTRLTAQPVTTLEFIDRAGTATSRYVIRAVDASGNESDESPVAVTVERRP